jgi:hypothetical protein
MVIWCCLNCDNCDLESSQAHATSPTQPYPCRPNMSFRRTAIRWRHLCHRDYRRSNLLVEESCSGAASVAVFDLLLLVRRAALIMRDDKICARQLCFSVAVSLLQISRDSAASTCRNTVTAMHQSSRRKSAWQRWAKEICERLLDRGHTILECG